MNGFPAFCENPSCGAIFQADNLFGGTGTATIQMTNTRVGPCPACGNFGLVPDGVYNYANEVISFLTGPKVSAEALQKVNSLLKSFKRNPRSKSEILKEIKSVSPEAAEAFEKAPDVKNYTHWLSILIALVALAMQFHTTYIKEDNSQVSDIFIEHLLQENRELKKDVNEIKTETNIPYKRTSPKIQRNDLCPCGSGKKYKKCCEIVEV